MAFLRSFLGGKQAMRSKSSSTPRGFMAVYVGENDDTKNRYVVPVSYLNQPLFQELLSKSEEEFGYDHPLGAGTGLTILCHESLFFTVTSQIR
ncbi:PREDICTED: auxin-responsive protein SAUR15 isoform X2 [Brassica oleracea var. oleracea]|uniref:auxin-responsive protein SAUR15 isoform X2 n=1 Tax=Brassica oleracea var. oleracea TaxID=109376 RepID=UPI0006A745A0|nr:PREDICTED: auxin-responsive protein SAUR15 isoform X2 [Brassica oleracea var. oleracea]